MPYNSNSTLILVKTTWKYMKLRSLPAIRVYLYRLIPFCIIIKLNWKIGEVQFYMYLNTFYVYTYTFRFMFHIFVSKLYFKLIRLKPRAGDEARETQFTDRYNLEIHFKIYCLKYTCCRCISVTLFIFPFVKKAFRRFLLTRSVCHGDQRK